MKTDTTAKPWEYDYHARTENQPNFSSISIFQWIPRRRKKRIGVARAFVRITGSNREELLATGKEISRLLNEKVITPSCFTAKIITIQAAKKQIEISSRFLS